MKKYYIQHNVGKIKYMVVYHDGFSKHKDGSEFFDVALFSNKQKLAIFVAGLNSKGFAHI